jgi:hypothetical protein
VPLPRAVVLLVAPLAAAGADDDAAFEPGFDFADAARTLADAPLAAMGQARRQLLASPMTPRAAAAQARIAGALRPPRRVAGAAGAQSGDNGPQAALTSPPVAIAGQTLALTKTTSLSGRDASDTGAPPADVRPLDPYSTADALLGRATPGNSGPRTPSRAAPDAADPPAGKSWLGITAASADTKQPSGYDPPDQGLCAGNGYVVEMVGGSMQQAGLCRRGCQYR